LSKILKNNTALAVFIPDTGKTVPASGALTIDPNLYNLFASSSNTVTFIGDGTLTVNDGSSDLSISAGVDLIKGLFPRLEIQTPTITNQTITLADTEVTVNIGASTKWFSLRSRQPFHKLQIATTMGASNTVYSTIFPGTSYQRSILRPASPGPTFYIRSNTAGTILEIEQWE
jgi:hypothetical protein